MSVFSKTVFMCDLSEVFYADVHDRSPDKVQITISHAWGTEAVYATPEEAREAAAALLAAADACSPSTP